MAHQVIMPALGMAQESGVIVAWHKAPGDAVKAGEILMEVETDKAVMEVEAGADGIVTELRAAEGDDVPVGEPVAVIGGEGDAVLPAPGRRAPRADAAKAAAVTAAQVAPAPRTAPEPESAPAGGTAPPAPALMPAADGRILASPKARRQAEERGLDLRRLVEAGRPQPYRMADLDLLAAMPVVAGRTAPPALLARALVPAAAFDGFLTWLGTEVGIETAAGPVLAAFAAGALRAATGGDTSGRSIVLRLSGPREAPKLFKDPDRAGIADLAPLAEPRTADLILHDLTRTRLSLVELGAVPAPTLSVARDGDFLVASLAAAAGQLDDDAMIACLDGFAGRLDEPLRHLL